ncbi:hypothetical protein CF327_g1772 [Tilletia walkeri]|nr:hypothetical protein CF327_g1772 [Tilletia walkeri]
MSSSQPGSSSAGAGAGGGAGGPSPILPNNASSNPTAPPSEQHLQVVLEYLQRRGFSQTEQALRAELQGLSTSAPHKTTVTIGELAASAALTLDQASTQGAGGVVGGGEDVDALHAAEEAIRLDPTDRARGFGMLKAWCEDSLDIYRAELCGALLPLFVHCYLDLVTQGHPAAASAFFAAHQASFLPTYSPLLTTLRSITLPTHVSTDPLAQRFRTERYIVKMTQAVFSLFLSWLTDSSTAAMAASTSISGANGSVSVADSGAEGPLVRGRDAMLKVINERCRIQLLKKTRTEIDSATLEEGSGLTSAVQSNIEPTARSQRSAFHSSLQVSAVSHNDAVSDYNARAAGQLKLGPKVPRSAELEDEIRRELREEARRIRAAELVRNRKTSQRQLALSGSASGTGVENLEQDEEFVQMAKREIAKAAANADVSLDPTSSSSLSGAGPSSSSAAGVVGSTATGGPTTSLSSQPLIQPTEADMPPHPPTFRTVDIMREVSRIKDARRSIVFGASPAVGTSNSSSNGRPPPVAGTDVPAHGYLTGVRDPVFNGLGEAGAQAARAAILPSICAYTFHDAEDGVTCAAFSEDATLMAAGFEESYVQIWNLKGEPLRGLRSDFALSQIKDRDTLRKFRQRSVTSTRKLIGHSGPVYSLSFDPIAGSASPPRHLLSSSADGTARLWCLDTFSALVSYRGHQHPVWDVKWSPLGIYFATASADKTARLWSTERINPLRIYAGHLSDVDCLDFHPNTLYLATGSSDRTSRLWDVQRGACVRLFIGHNAPISTLKVSPCGRYLATAGAGHGSYAGVPPASLMGATDTTISLWDLGSGRRIKKMWGHTAPVHSLTFSSDGAMLVSSAADWTVRCWDIRGAGGPRKTGSAAAAAAASAAAAAASSAMLGGGLDGSNGNAADGAGGPGATSGPGGMATHLEMAASSSIAHLNSSVDCLATFHTRRTPMTTVHFTKRNLCLAAGAMQM